MDEAVKNRNI